MLNLFGWHLKLVGKLHEIEKQKIYANALLFSWWLRVGLLFFEISYRLQGQGLGNKSVLCAMSSEKISEVSPYHLTREVHCYYILMDCCWPSMVRNSSISLISIFSSYQQNFSDLAHPQLLPASYSIVGCSCVGDMILSVSKPALRGSVMWWSSICISTVQKTLNQMKERLASPLCA